MTDETASSQAASPSRRAALLWTVIPFLVLAAAIAWLFGTNPLRSFENGAPPVPEPLPVPAVPPKIAVPPAPP